MNRRRTYARSVFGAALVLLVGCRSLGSEAGAVTPTPTSLPATAPPVVAGAPGKPLACPAPPAPSTVPARAQPTPAAPSASGSVLFILDASSSMLDDDGSGHRKIDSAKAALSGLVETLPRGARVGLRIYGDRVPDTDKANGCTDTHLVVPVGPLDPAAIKAAIGPVSASGGEYRDAANAGELADLLKVVASRALKSYQTAGNLAHGGGSFNDAAQLQPGQYQDTLVADETLYYALNLAAGQELRASATIVGQPDLKQIGQLDRAMAFKLTTYDAARKEVNFDSSAFYGDTTDSRAATLQAVSRAGVYYVSLTLERMNSPPMQGHEFMTELLLEVVGGPSATPCP